MNAIALVFLAATIPLRNPFWPIGYEGVREVISDQPRVAAKAQVENAVEEDTKTSVTAEALAAAQEVEDDTQYNERLWVAAKKSLKIGGNLRTSNGRQAVAINGSIYADGDFISANVDGRRFTWQVKRPSKGGTLSLQRIRFRELEEDLEDKGENK